MSLIAHLFVYGLALGLVAQGIWFLAQRPAARAAGRNGALQLIAGLLSLAFAGWLAFIGQTQLSVGTR